MAEWLPSLAKCVQSPNTEASFTQRTCTHVPNAPSSICAWCCVNFAATARSITQYQHSLALLRATAATRVNGRPRACTYDHARGRASTCVVVRARAWTCVRSTRVHVRSVNEAWGYQETYRINCYTIIITRSSAVAVIADSTACSGYKIG